MSALELQRLSTPVLAGCCGLIAGGMLVMAASSNLSPVIAGLAMCGLLVAVAIMFSPSLGLLLTAAVIPIERLGRLTADTNMYTVSLMRIIGLLALASFLVHAFNRKWKFRFGKPFFAYLVYCGLAILTRSKASEARMAIDIPYWNPANTVAMTLLTQMMASILEMCQ